MISGLQGEFGDLDNKYLKQNISKCQLEISGSFMRTVQLCVSDWVGATRGSRYVWPEKLKRPPLPSGCEISGCKMLAYGILSRVDWAMLRKGDRSAHGYLDSQAERQRNAIRCSSIRTIAYTIRICCPDGKHWLKWVSEPCYYPRSTALQWCVRTPCPDIFCHGFQRTLLNLGLLWRSKSYQNTKT